MKNEVVKFGVILFVISAICAGLVSFAYEKTAPIIEKQKIEADNAARKITLPEAEEFKKVEGDFPEEIIEVYEGLKGSEVVGYSIKASNKGYGGPVEVNTGITVDGKIAGAKTGEMNETPGLGAKAETPEFIDQYKDKSIETPLEVVKTPPSKDNEIQAIAGATITSKCVTKSVNDSVELYKEKFAK